MRLVLGGQTSSGLLRDRTYLSTEYAMVGERLAQLSEVINGPEWSIFTYANESGERIREFRAAQVLGTGTIHRISQPGTLVEWSYTVDAAGAATSHLVRGGGTSTGTTSTTRWVVVRNANLSHMGQGWPI